jgi:kinesin family protein 18/19
MSSKAEVEMDEHMKAMWAGQSNVLVAVRVRPLMKHDQVKKGCVRVLDTKVVVICDPATGDKQDILRANRSREKQYAFDYVCEPKTSQETTYLHTAKFLIHGILDGFNATVFAYGQTGSGKVRNRFQFDKVRSVTHRFHFLQTHTMIGSESEPGIMVRVMDDLFRASLKEGKAQGVTYKMSVSFLEVYNENIRDLLSDTEEYLDLREDPIKGPVVASNTHIEATTSQEIMRLLHQGNSKRSQAATAANEVSSRSHAVLQVVVENRDRAPGTVANIKVGKLSLVDLAGSERAANTKNVGARLVEGANINRSLLALGNCINALGEKGNKGNFVPYRDSKLTRLLKDSLGGNCRTVMIACISSAESSFEETLNTLKYANRAKNIKTHVQRNVLNVNYHISEYVQLIDNLRGEIQVLKNQISVGEKERAPTSRLDLRSRQQSPTRVSP